MCSVQSVVSGAHNWRRVQVWPAREIRKQTNERTSESASSLALSSQLVETKGNVATPLKEKIEDVVTVEIVGSNFKVWATIE